MKKTATRTYAFITSVSSLLAFSFLFSIASISAQSVEHAAIGDYSKVVWRPITDMTSVIAQEDTRMDAYLATPDLQDSDRAIYIAYKRMLAYTQALIQDNKPVDEAIFEGYEKVIAEAPGDKYLAFLPEGLLMTYIPVLVEALAEVPVPELSGN